MRSRNARCGLTGTLSAVCPSNAATDRTSREWEQFADGRRSVPFGTPVPSDLRRAYRHQSKVEARSGMKFARWDWPDRIAAPAQRMARGFYRDAEVAQKRAESRTVTRAWLQGWAKVGAAPRTMRVALGLATGERGPRRLLTLDDLNVADIDDGPRLAGGFHLRCHCRNVR